MKKVIKIFISVLLLVSLFACNNTNNTNTNNSNDDDVSDNLQNSDASEANDQKTLVVYFSATGSTKRVAEYIAQYTSGDIFELVPEENYNSEDLRYTNPNSRVSREHDDPSLQNIKLVSTTPDNFCDYDTIFIGYPIWWGLAAWPINSFITENDFTNKNIIPFCTSASSPLGDSSNSLKSMSNSGNWLDGTRFASSVSQKDVENWLSNLK